MLQCKGRQTLQSHLHIAKMSDRCYRKVAAPLSLNKFKSSALNATRGIESEEEMYRILCEWSKKDFKTGALKQDKSVIKKSSKKVFLNHKGIFVASSQRVNN